MQIEMNSHFVKVVYQINIKVSLEYAKLVVIIIVFILFLKFSYHYVAYLVYF